MQNQIVEDFSFETLKAKFEAEPLQVVGKVTFRKVSEDVKNYVNRYFFRALNGNYYFWDRKNKELVIYDKETITDVYFTCFPPEVKKWFINENTKRYGVICDTKKPLIGEDYVNMFKEVLYKNVKTYDKYDAKIKERVALFLKYIKEVLCSNNNTIYQYILQWIANMAKGNKNDAVLYLRGPEGIGKSTLTDFLHDHVLGKLICSKSVKNAEALKTSFNKILLGKLLVVFEELPNFNEREWEGISSTLKDMATNNKMYYRDLYEKAFYCENINNYIINTNVDAIKHSEGRRYFILDLSTKRKGDHEYFGNLRDKCFNDEVGEAFYSYLLSVDTEKFYAQNMPITESKLNAIAERLDTTYKFLKNEYILHRRGINQLLSDLHLNYEMFCGTIDKKPLTKIKFSEKLKEVNIVPIKSSGQLKIKITYEQLADIAEKNKWIHELDEYKDNADNEEGELDENERLKQQIKELEEKIKKLTPQTPITRILKN